ncbi:MAG: DNA-3-methyladenine glycosylase [Bifidobacteriaceae bacterium]|jgi:DNA-3-methyladenine glycosylase|nr:DNA-3-methyladenine glycosylase [Bifidobacteriaceae bacterium]
MADQFLSTDFFTRDVLDVAPGLLGAKLCRRRPDGRVERRRITEVEAYRGEEDTACHARAGRTKRTAVMYGPGGHAYVYLCYGIHHLLNVVTGGVGEPQAALVRGLEGASGPGRATGAMGIDLTLNGLLLEPESGLWLEPGAPPPRFEALPRVGIGYASPADQARPWRFLAASLSRAGEPRP